jgi:hypothetical protein
MRHAGRQRGHLAPMAALLVAMLAAAGARAQPDGSKTEVAEIAMPDGASQRVLYDAPARPRATLVMLPGGAGDIGIKAGGQLRHADNFVVRTRAAWVANGYAVIIPDAPGGIDLRGQRSSAAYGEVVDAFARFAQDRAAVPVFLLGTSQGSIAAMNGAVAAPPGLLAGMILTESVSVNGGSHETVFDARPAAVRVPALVVANRDDRCRVAPPDAAHRIAAALRNAPTVTILEVQGGLDEDGNPCGSLSPHGYDGIETIVVTKISAWIDGHLNAN